MKQRETKQQKWAYTSRKHAALFQVGCRCIVHRKTCIQMRSNHEKHQVGCRCVVRSTKMDTNGQKWRKIVAIGEIPKININRHNSKKWRKTHPMVRRWSEDEPRWSEDEPRWRLWEALGRLWGALGRLRKAFRAFLLLPPPLPHLYIKKNQTPDQPLLAAPYYNIYIIY